MKTRKLNLLTEALDALNISQLVKCIPDEAIPATAKPFYNALKNVASLEDKVWAVDTPTLVNTFLITTSELRCPISVTVKRELRKRLKHLKTA